MIQWRLVCCSTLSCTVLRGDFIVAVFSSKSNPLSHGKGTNPSSTAVYSLGSHKAINPLNRKRGRNQCVFHFMLFHKKTFSWAGKLVACFQIARFSTRPQNSRGRRKMKYSLRNVVFPGEDRDKWCCLFLCSWPPEQWFGRLLRRANGYRGRMWSGPNSAVPISLWERYASWYSCLSPTQHM